MASASPSQLQQRVAAAAAVAVQVQVVEAIAVAIAGVVLPVWFPYLLKKKTRRFRKQPHKPKKKLATFIKETSRSE